MASAATVTLLLVALLGAALAKNPKDCEGAFRIKHIFVEVLSWVCS
jgi:hypothetical protein